MDDASGVGGIQGRRQTADHLDHFIYRQGAIFYLVGQRAAGHVAHHDVWLALFLAKIVHGHNGGMLQQSDHFCLALEASAKLGVVQKFTRQHFDGYIAFESRVIGVEN